MKKVNEIPENIIVGLNEILKKIQIVATQEYLEDLLNDTHVKDSMIEINGIDTAEREMFMDTLAYKLTGNLWPSNSDPDDYANSFLKKFIEAVQKEEGLSFLPQK